MNENVETKEVSKKLTQPIMDLITKFFQTKVDDFSKDGDRPSSYQAQSIVDSYALKCASVSGFASLAPGPLGMLTIIPDLIIVLRLQTEMLAKLSVAYNKEKVISKELVLFMLFQSVGVSGIKFVVVKSAQVVVKRASARLLQRIVSMMGGRVLQRTAGQAVARWIPGLGAAAMAIWVRYMTRKIGSEAMHLLSKDIVFEGEFDEESTMDEMNETINKEISPLQEIKKLKALIKVAQADGFIHDNERKLFIESIDKSGINQSIKNELISALTPDNDITLVLPKLQTEDEKVAFMLQLIAMAKIDNHFSEKEKVLILDIGKKLDLDDDDIMALL